MWLRLLQRRGFWMVVSSLLALCLFVSGVLKGSPAQAEPTSLQAAVVDIALAPSSITVDVNDTFTLDIYVYPNGQPVDAMDAALAFHPRYLEVQSITGDPSGLEFELTSIFDNTAGTLTHSRGASMPPEPPPSSDFRLCSISLKAKAATEGTILAFTDLTDAYFEGASLLRNTINGTVTITWCPSGDLDYDGDVDIDDVMKVASRWRTSCAKPDPDNNPDTPNYDPLYDLDGDCDIDVVDIMLVVVHWGETC